MKYGNLLQFPGRLYAVVVSCTPQSGYHWFRFWQVVLLNAFHKILVIATYLMKLELLVSCVMIWLQFFSTLCPHVMTRMGCK